MKERSEIENSLSFKKCDVSSISIYPDFELNNVNEDQMILIGVSQNEIQSVFLRDHIE